MVDVWEVPLRWLLEAALIMYKLAEQPEWTFCTTSSLPARPYSAFQGIGSSAISSWFGVVFLSS